MMKIVTRELKVKRPGQLTIDVVVNLPSRRYHISRLAYTKKGLYDVPLTYKAEASPIDVHDSYHPSGEIHGKLTRGKLIVLPDGQVLDQAKPHTKDKEVVLWRRNGQPWNSLKGVERIAANQKCFQVFMDIEALAAGYPLFGESDADYVFEIERQSLPSKWIDLAIYLVAKENHEALENELRQNRARRPISLEYITVEKAELFTNLNPWLAIVVFCRKDS